jgi:predicted kinase
MHGLSCSGKSSVSQALSDGIDAVRIRSDVERKRLRNLSALDRSVSPVGGGIYTPEMTRTTYDYLLHRADVILAAGISVIVDASFLRQAERRRFRDLAERRGVPLRILDCRARLPDLHERLRARAAAGGDASEATAAVLDAQMENRDPLTPEERACAVDIDTTEAGNIRARLHELGVERRDAFRSQ